MESRNNRGRLENTRRREIKIKMNSVGRSWKEMQEMAKDKMAWQELVEALCFISLVDNGQKK